MTDILPSYIPPSQILQKYADLLVWFALRQGDGETGIKAGDVVLIQVPECAKPMLEHLQHAVLTRGGHPILRLIPDGLHKPFFQQANDEQLAYMPEQSLLGRVEDIDHSVYMIAEADKHELEGIDPSKIMARSSAMKFYRDAIHSKENKKEFTWTLWLYGTQAMADEVGLTLEAYRWEIINACYLHAPDPIAERERIDTDIENTKASLNALPIERLHIKWEDVDLKVQLWKDRKRLWGRGRNIPSYEVFISPDWRGTQWWIKFNQPLYRYGNLITGIELQFHDWKVTDARATQNEQMLKQMIATKDADKVGEFSLTDSRLSRITKFMGETLYDENVWGQFGNTHIALGMAYKDSFPWDASLVTDEQRREMWYNDSVVHTDIVSTTDRVVTATLADGSEMVIYQDGKFVV